MGFMGEKNFEKNLKKIMNFFISLQLFVIFHRFPLISGKVDK